MSYQTVRWEINDGIATLTLNRPDKLNALSNKMTEEILDILPKVQGDDNIKVMIITGAGSSFCSGADIKERFFQKIEMKKKGEMWDELLHGFTEKCCHHMSKITKPVIGALNGMAFGFGATFALCCDIRIASEDLKIGYGFVRMGVIPEFGSSYFLPRLLGIAKACELVFTGKTLDAKEALQIGLVNQVVPAESLMETTNKMASNLAKSPPISMQLAKQLLYQGLNTDLNTQLRLEAMALDACRGSLDHEEAANAFLEKRKPDFKGK